MKQKQKKLKILFGGGVTGSSCVNSIVSLLQNESSGDWLHNINATATEVYT